MDRETATSTLPLLLEERILLLFLKAGGDTHAQVAGPSPTSATSRNRAAIMIFLEFCFDILSKSPPIQALCLDVLAEFLHRTSTWVPKNTIYEFCTTLRNRDRDELRWESPFLAEVKNTLRVSLAARGPGTAEDLQKLDRTANLVFPSNLVTPMATGTGRSRRKRKQECGPGQQRKSHRMAWNFCRYFEYEPRQLERITGTAKIVLFGTLIKMEPPNALTQARRAASYVSSVRDRNLARLIVYGSGSGVCKTPES